MTRSNRCLLRKMYVSIVNVVFVCVRGGGNGLCNGPTSTGAQVSTGNRSRRHRSHRWAAGCTGAGVEMRQKGFRYTRMRFCLLLEHRFGLWERNSLVTLLENRNCSKMHTFARCSSSPCLTASCCRWSSSCFRVYIAVNRTRSATPFSTSVESTSRFILKIKRTILNKNDHASPLWSIEHQRSSLAKAIGIPLQFVLIFVHLSKLLHFILPG